MKKEIVVDRRVQRTRKILLDALVALILEKGYDAITIQDIIDRANVGRSTFYAHFQDKDDLFLSGFESLRKQFEEHFLGQGQAIDSPWVFSLIIFEHIQEQPRLFKAMMGKNGSNMMTAHFNKYLTFLIREHMKAQMPDKNKERIPLDVLVQYLISSLLALITWWLDHDLPYPAHQMNEMFEYLTRPGIEPLFKLE